MENKVKISPNLFLTISEDRQHFVFENIDGEKLNVSYDDMLSLQDILKRNILFI